MGWYGWGHDMGWAGWLAMWLIMVAFWGLLAAAVWWLLRTIRRGYREGAAPTAPTARQILDERLARGELTEEEYLRRRDLLQAH